MNDQKELLQRTGERILTLARNELYVSMRFLDIALFRLGFEMNLSTRTAGTDGSHILFNPSWLADTYLDDPLRVNRLYMHILMHNLFCHDFSGKSRNRENWNLACDIAAESVIDSIKDRSVHITVSDYREYVYTRLRGHMQVLNAQSVYYYLENTFVSHREFERMCSEFKVDDHSFWEQHESEERSRGQENRRKQDRQEWEYIGRKIQTNLETYAKDRGEDTGHLLTSLKLQNRPRDHFRDFLRRFAVWGEEILSDEDSFDYIFYTYGLNHYGNLPLIESLEYKDVKKIEEFVIAIDTSASCPPDMIRIFLSETFAMLSDRESFFAQMQIHIIQADAGVHTDTVIHNRRESSRFMEEFSVHGGGGTDFRPVFSYVNSLLENGVFQNLKGLLYFTDGIGEYPQEQPPYETAFIFIGNDYIDRQVPVWAIRQIYTPEELHELQTEG